MGDRHWFVLYVLICLEVGVFLLLVPWSTIWERNYFLQAYPALDALILDPIFRGAVSGLGVANIYVGLGEVMERKKRAQVPSSLFPDGFRLRALERRERETSPGERSSSPAEAEARALIAHEKRT